MKNEFLNYINEVHPTIKYMWSSSKEQVNYLDVQVINNQGKIKTDLYIKRRDKHQCLFIPPLIQEGVSRVFHMLKR